MEKAWSERFQGVNLNKKQIANLREYAVDVLGEKYYSMTLGFFSQIWNSSARYKVFMARRCLNLMYTIYRAEHSTPIVDLQRTFYSDSSLVANSLEIAECYKKLGFFPEILIVDDILIHGRALNTLIDSLIDSVCGCFDDVEIKEKKQVIEHDLLNSITIKVMVQNDKPLLIRPNYYQRLDCAPDMSDVWEPRQWHDLSSKISRLISENYFYNTSFILSQYQYEKSPSLDSIENRLSELGFAVSKWNKRYLRDVWVKPLKNENGDIKAFYTVRVTENVMDNSYTFVPYVIMSDFDLNELDDHSAIKKAIGLFKVQIGTERFCSETLYLIFSYNLLRIIMGSIGLSNEKNDNIDLDKISINFNKKTESSHEEYWISGIINNADIEMSFEEMDRLILKSTEKSIPLASADQYDDDGTLERCDRDFERILSNAGFEIEKDAYKRYTGKNGDMSEVNKPPLSGLLHGIKYKKAEDLMGSLLRIMDMGIVALSTNFDSVPGHNVVSCRYRAGEQSQFICTRRLYSHIPTLTAIESDCHFIKEDIKERIDEFYSDRKDEIKIFKEYVDRLYDSGQKITDWNINLLNWIEVDDETIVSSDMPQKLKILSQMTAIVNYQVSELDSYRDKYRYNK